VRRQYGFDLNFGKAKVVKILLPLLMALGLLTGCAPEVGSQQWCDDLKEKPKNDWTMQEASDFAKNCLFK